MRAIPRLLLVLALLLPLLAACGPESAPTSPPPTDTPRPAATARPTDTPRPSDTPEPTETPTPEPTDTPVPTPTPAARFELAACPFDLPAGQVEGETVECGYVVVPEDRADPDSPTIRLAVATFHHPDGDPESDPVLYLEGGPGMSALEFLSLTFTELSKPAFAANRDLVVFDQRGVGLSEPALDCPELLELGRELLDWEVDGETITEEEAIDLVLQTTIACGETLARVADLSAYNTAANAADVNDLRLALGYDEVNLWSVSYGTHLALTVMRDHPEGLRSVVLDSVYPLDVDLYLEMLPNLDRAFDVLFEDCAADEACNTHYPDLRTVFFETANHLNETPASFQVTDPFTGESYEVLLTGDDLVGLLHQLLYRTNLLPVLPQMIYNASQGTFDQAARILGLLIGMEETLSHGMFYSVRCRDELAFSTLDQFEAVAADYPELTRFLADGIGSLSYGICEDWDSGQPGEIENRAVTSDIPALILAGEYDPVTAPAWGQHAAETLENGYFYEYPGVGHGASVGVDCPREMMVAFLDDPTRAPDDACIAEMDLPQFVVPVEAGAIDLEPFTNEQMGIQGLVPAGWTEVNLGVYARNTSATDAAVLLAQAAPVTAKDLLALVSSQLGLEELPEAVGDREANGLTWTLYAVTVQGVEIDMALTGADGLALIVLLQSDPGEHEALYEAVFLPVIDSMAPLTQRTADVIVIGINAPLTGDIPKVGEETRFAVEMWLQQIEAAGGLEVGAETYQVELAIEDNGSNGEEAAAANVKMITQDGVLVIVGPQSSKQAVPAGGVANDLECPMISPWSTHPNTTLDRPWVFRTPFLDAAQGVMVARFVTEEFGFSKAAVLYDPTSNYPMALAETFREAWENTHGPGSVVALESFEVGDTDFTEQLTTIKGSGADFIFVPQYYNEVAWIVTQARALGWDKPILGSDTWGTADLVDLCGEACHGLFFTTHFMAAGAPGAANEFVERYVEEYGYVPSDAAALSWDTLLLVQQAIEDCGEITGDLEVDRQCVRDGLAELSDFEGITGKLVFDNEGDPIKCAVVARISDEGEFEFYRWICPEELD